MLLARVPVFNEHSAVAGFAVHYGSGDDALTHDVVFINTLLSATLDQLRQRQPAYLSVTPSMIARSRAVLQPGRTVLVISSDGTDEGVAICRERKRAGFSMVLDAGDGDADSELLDVVDSVRLDVRNFDDALLAQHAATLQARGLRLLATGVSSRAHFERCRALGFSLFEGYDIGRPDASERREPSVQYVRVLRALKMARDFNVPERTVADEFQHDAALSYRLLRIINIAGIGAVDVRSIPHGIQLIGRTRLFQWLALLLMSPMSVEAFEEEVMRAAVLRARFCEQLADISTATGSTGSAYIVGLLSAIGPFAGVSAEECAAELQLAEEPARAIVAARGPLGELLNVVLAYESGDFAAAISQAARIRVAPAALAACYADAVTFASRTALAVAV
jgi:EAL and modified HD-GYP domain-containing signal transduction protein